MFRCHGRGREPMWMARAFMNKTKMAGGEGGAREWAYGDACARDQDDIVA